MKYLVENWNQKTTEKQQESTFHSFVIKGDYQDIIHDCSRSSRHISHELAISLTYCH